MMRSLVIYTTIAIGIVTASYDERRLYEDLMRDYNSLERPVANHSKPVTVYLKVSLQQIIDVDEKNQIVYVNAWLDYLQSNLQVQLWRYGIPLPNSSLYVDDDVVVVWRDLGRESTVQLSKNSE
ncbi:unnamed protein product [Heligmosomoides polygyrus]|uniref:Neur_chan_LBD domain-containing protein n=1 Tax=Heligmosomoides polygyrus TaxID=6339 RepID=A0A183G7Z6_HELPZ|nr:unnamed protein product [Heligmosomoides polygyrus]